MRAGTTIRSGRVPSHCTPSGTTGGTWQSSCRSAPGDRDLPARGPKEWTTHPIDQPPKARRQGLCRSVPENQHHLGRAGKEVQRAHPIDRPPKTNTATLSTGCPRAADTTPTTPARCHCHCPVRPIAVRRGICARSTATRLVRLRTGGRRWPCRWDTATESPVESKLPCSSPGSCAQAAECDHRSESEPYCGIRRIRARGGSELCDRLRDQGSPERSERHRGVREMFHGKHQGC